MLWQALRIIWHGLPLVPLFFERYFLVVAGILLVLLPYIKVKKLRSRQGNADSNERQADYVLAEKWRKLTFLLPDED